MACLIPDELPRTATLAERRFAAMATRLPNGCVIYHQAETGGSSPDFVLVSPRLGIIAFEVMGCPPSIVTPHSIQCSRAWWEDAAAPPSNAIRAAGYLCGLAEEITRQAQANPSLWRSLHVQTGENAGKLRFPINRLVVMIEITSTMTTNWGPEGDKFFQCAAVIPANIFEQWEGLAGNALSQAIGERRPAGFPFDALRGREVDTIRGVLRPGIRLNATLGGPRALPPAGSVPPSLLDGLRESWANRVRVLTAEQEATVSAIVRSRAHRLVVGPPGSGKTVVLARAAGRLAEINHHAAAQPAILVLTYNKGIARALSTPIRDDAGAFSGAIEVSTFHAFVRAHYGIRFQPGETDAAFGELVLAAIAEREAAGQGPRRYKGILVDEVQTWDSSWLKCAIAHLSGDRNDCLVLAGDGGQQLYGRGSFTWKSVGFHYHISRRHLLTVNRRCPQEIQALAAPFAAPNAAGTGGQGAIVGVSETCAEAATILAIPPRVETAMPSGYRPLLLQCHNREGEIAAVLQAVRDALEGRWRGEPLVDGPLAPSDIGILYPRLVGGEKAFRHIEALAAGLNQICDAVWITPPGNRKAQRKNGAITIQTIHYATGLEYRLVIVIQADVLPWQRRDTRLRPSSRGPSNGAHGAAADEDRMLMYIAMTRSTELLMVTWSGDGSEYTQRLLRAHLRHDHAKPP